jgi:hypothetical protein
MDSSSAQSVAGTARAAPVRIALAVLGCLFLINFVGASWRLYEIVTRVRPEARVEFASVYVSYPGALALLDIAAIVCLQKGKRVGRILASLIFT